MDEAVATFVSITGASEAVAARYLRLTDEDPMQAVQLFFDSPDLASGAEAPPAPASDPIPSFPAETANTTHPAGSSRFPTRNTVTLDDSDDEPMDVDEDAQDAGPSAAATHNTSVAHGLEEEDDEAMARRLQNEMYAGGDASGGFEDEEVRAPLQRTTETMVGGHQDFMGGFGRSDLDDDILEQMRARTAGRRAPPPGIFNQRNVRSVWDESADEETQRQGLAQATGGASNASAKLGKLAELFRPPFDIMSQIPWDQAREQGKDEQKWILVNIQNPSIFDCQQLNRDIWKHQGIREIIKESFIFMQFTKDDPRGNTYTQYYFQAKESDAAYPHIAIVDPRTGEQVKIWSGPPIPKPGDFLMQLVEFLDRYSLDSTKKNPVAKRKVEKPKAADVDKLTEDEMLDLALQNSLATSGTPGPKEDDPDDLTKSFGDISKGKGKEVEEDSSSSSAADTTFLNISSSHPHTQPPAGPTTTRIQFRHSDGRVVHSFTITDPVRRIYEWLKAEPLPGKEGVAFELKERGKDMIDHLDETIEEAGLKNTTLMVEFLED